MSKTPNMLSAIEPWDLVANGYAETTMQMLAHFADEAIAASRLKPGAVILDVACGPGTLALMVAREGGEVRGIDFSVPMLDIFRQHVERTGLKNISIRHGDAQELPYADNTFDAAFSMFGLMFFPDRRKGCAEIYRTLKPGGTIAATSWAPIQMMKKGMGETAWKENEGLAIRYLEERLTELPTWLSSDAWLGLGVKSR
jgi:ubiquinone/menaquinone biosynthesis C-methylase UbiE